MPNQFDVSVIEFKKVDDMPGSWDDKDYHNLLNMLEVDGLDEVSGEELLEMSIMALQDLEPEKAADNVLAYKLRNAVSAGVRQNIIQDMLENDSPWEEYADISLHKYLFAASVLLHKAFPSSFSKPKIIRLSLEIKTSQFKMRDLFLTKPNPAFVARILADGMDEDCILERLFEDQLLSHHFPEAENIIWHAEYPDLKEDDVITAKLVIYSSTNWLEDMENIEDFHSTAYYDKVPENLKGHK